MPDKPLIQTVAGRGFLDKWVDPEGKYKARQGLPENKPMTQEAQLAILQDEEDLRKKQAALAKP